ncbi:MAG: inorganic diphosphatase [Flavobacteriales bacterium]|nr:inorganic diphosphatase [Flavobacteriales bacterium]
MRGSLNILCLGMVVLLGACNNAAPLEEKATPSKDLEPAVNHQHLIDGYPAVTADGWVNVVVEIPTGTIEKWEVDKESGQLLLEQRNGADRKVAYLGYPGNYGMVPRTLLAEEQGGDGDPIDVLILGPPLERGSVVQCKVIGMLELLDRGEQDDKLIAVIANTVFYEVEGMEALDAKFNGVSDIIQIWFENYKGPGKIEAIAYRDKEIAEEILNSAIQSYQEEHN